MSFFSRRSSADDADSREADGSEQSCVLVDEETAARVMASLAGAPRVHQAYGWFRAHEREIAEFQFDITSIAAPPFGEQARSAWLAQRLLNLGYAVERDAMGNVYATSDVHDADTSDGAQAPVIALSAHLDTVFSPDTKLNIRREQHRLAGPGISDNGAGLAGLWAIAAALKACELDTELPILLIANVGEEGDGDLRGMRAVFNESRWRKRIASLLVLDGSGVETIVTEALGSRRFAVRVTGPGGHSWSDYGTPNPIVALGRAISVLSHLALPDSPRTTLNIGTIEGGTSINAIPEEAVMRVDIRSAASEKIDEVEAALRLAVAEAVRDTAVNGTHLQFTIEQVGERPGGWLQKEAPLLLAVNAADARLGIQSRTERASTDANIPLSLGVDALAIGAGGSGGGAHTLHEWYDPSGRDLALRRVLLVLLALAHLKSRA